MISPAQIRTARSLLDLSQCELADQAGITLRVLQRAEAERGAKASATAQEEIRRVLESAGVEFTNGDAPGVRMQKS